MSLEKLFFEFCGNVAFVNITLLQQAVPCFSPCLLDTFPVWIPCGYLWLTALPFLFFLYRRRTPPLPFSYKHLLKTAVCIGLVCNTELHLTYRQSEGQSCNGIGQLSEAAKTAMWIKLATYLLAAALLQVQKHKGLKTSAITFTFWLITVALESLQLYSYIMEEKTCRTHIIYYVHYGMLCLQLFMHCWAENSGQEHLPGERPCPEDDASILNRFTFNWIMPLIIACYRKRFSSFDMWKQTEVLKSSVIGPKLEANWLREFERYKTTKADMSKKTFEISEIESETKPLLSSEKEEIGDVGQETQRRLLLKTVLKTYWYDYAEFTLYAFVETILFFFQPLVLRVLIDYIDNKNNGVDPQWLGILYVVLMFVVIEASSITYNVTVHHTAKLGFKIKYALMYVIYKKALTLSKSDHTNSVGDIVNLMSVDCQRIQDAMFYSYYIVAFFVMAGGSFYLLWLIMGPATLGAIAMVAFIFPVNMFIARKQHGLQKFILKMKGKRVRLINEMLSGIKVLKMYAWELSFIQKVTDIRNKELKKFWLNSILMAISTSICNHGQFMIHYALILVYVLVRPDHYISSQDVFVSLAFVVVLKYPLTAVPTLFNGLVQAYVSLSRIEQFLVSADLPTANVVQSKSADKSIKVSNGTFTWENNEKSSKLNNINFAVKTGELIAIVGHCGSGKTSLISALLGEMRKLTGAVTYKGSIAYVPQEAWIQNMTLRDNILFGKDYNHSKYYKVIDNCALKPDLELLDGGDKTEIGEKGANISGGQKQRISLARAVYSNADIYLLDDPLSAVDAHVGKDLFKNVIGNTGMLKNKTRILVTHAIHWLPLVDNIVVLDNGTISEIGTYDELMTHNGAFAQFLLQYLTQGPDEGIDDPEIQWIRENMLELVETVTTEGAGSSDETVSDAIFRFKMRRKKKKKLNRNISGHGKLSQSLVPTTLPAPATMYDVSRLTTEEVVQEGSVKFKVFGDYFRAMGLGAALLSLVIMAIYQSLSIYAMFYLTFWTEDEYLKNSSLASYSEYSRRFTTYLVTYSLLGIFQGITVFWTFYLALTRLVTASGNLHAKMLLTIMRSPMSFFDTVPVGRILNRFASDIDVLDNRLPETYRVWTGMVFSTLASLVVMAVTTPIFIAVIVLAVILCAFLLKVYLPTARKMKRIEAVTRSPIYSHFTETLTGASVIRAYRCSERFLETARKRIDKNSTFYYATFCAQRWVSVRLELLGCVIVSLSTLFVVLSNDLNGAELGLTVTYAVQLAFSLNSVVWALAEMEMNVVSVERVTEYTALPSEAVWNIQSTRPEPSWPTSGVVQYKNYSTRYRPGLDLVLKGITCEIKSEEKIGVVGRTGAGKSSMTLSLFRIIERAGGHILIDGVSIDKLGLHDLRSSLTILPQDPVLFSSSLRMNIDPMERFSDADIWKVVEASHLKSFVMSQAERLLYDCGDAGSNLSVGQRQLVCLARTLLYKTKILILDEATAAVDMQTDDLIQQTIRTQFNDCTIITIAHRLNTIMDYDRVMVLDKGQIKEFDKPKELLKKTDGVFHSMAKDAGLI